MDSKKCPVCGRSFLGPTIYCPSCESTHSQNNKNISPKRDYSTYVWIIGLIVLAMVLGNATNNKQPNSNLSHNTASVSFDKSKVKLQTTWRKIGFNAVMEADFTIDNQSQNAIKDIKITCSQVAKSGTVLGSNSNTIYDTVDRKGYKHFNKFNMGFIHSQADRVACSIYDFEILQ